MRLIHGTERSPRTTSSAKTATCGRSWAEAGRPEPASMTTAARNGRRRPKAPIRRLSLAVERVNAERGPARPTDGAEVALIETKHIEALVTGGKNDDRSIRKAELQIRILSDDRHRCRD